MKDACASTARDQFFADVCRLANDADAVLEFTIGKMHDSEMKAWIRLGYLLNEARGTVERLRENERAEKEKRSAG